MKDLSREINCCSQATDQFLKDCSASGGEWQVSVFIIKRKKAAFPWAAETKPCSTYLWDPAFNWAISKTWEKSRWRRRPSCTEPTVSGWKTSCSLLWRGWDSQGVPWFGNWPWFQEQQRGSIFHMMMMSKNSTPLSFCEITEKGTWKFYKYLSYLNPLLPKSDF